MRVTAAVVALLVTLWSCQSANPPAPAPLRPVQVGKLWGYADDSGAMRIPPRFHWANDFTEGRAMVTTKYGWGVRFINARGEVASGEQFFEWAGPFSEGVAPARLADRRYGFIDARGRLVREPNYFGVKSFSEGLAAVQLSEGGEWGFVDHEFHLAIPARFAATSEFNAGLAPAKDSGGLWGFVDKTGAWAIAPRFAEAEDFSTGDALAPVRIGMGWGYVNRTGNLAWPAEYEAAKGFHDGYAPAKAGGQWGLVDTRGNWTLPPRFDELHPPQRGWAQARTGERYGYVNIQGERRHWTN